MTRQSDASDLTDIAAKIDFLIKQDQSHILDAHEVLALRRMIKAWAAAEGFVSVTKQVGLVIAFIVILWTQWDRLIEMIGNIGSKP